MSYIILLNDVDNVFNTEGLLSGNLDCVLTDNGMKQIDSIVNVLDRNYSQQLTHIVTSNNSRIVKMLHHIQIASKFIHSSNTKLWQTNAIRERDFGYREGGSYSLKEDMFRVKKIGADSGETIIECKNRLVTHLKKNILLQESPINCLLMSHRFSCQILSNALLKKKYPILTDFWINNVSLMVFDIINRKFVFREAYNCSKDKQQTLDEIYTGIL